MGPRVGEAPVALECRDPVAYGHWGSLEKGVAREAHNREAVPFEL